jgi:hypothetical protein
MIYQYFKSKGLIFKVLFFYLSCSFVLKLVFDIDFLLPCIWKKIFDHECLGCGLSRAFIELVKLNFEKAYSYNKLIFIVFPFSMFLFILDFKKLKSK